MSLSCSEPRICLCSLVCLKRLNFFLHSIYHEKSMIFFFIFFMICTGCSYWSTHICLCLNVSTRAYVLTGSPQDIKGPWIICPAGGPTGIQTFSHTQTHNCSSQKALWLAAYKLFRGRHNYNSLLSSIPVSGHP